MINPLEKTNFSFNEKNQVLTNIERFKDHDKLQTRNTELLGLDENKEGLKKVATEFEGMFISMLLREMRSTVDNEDGIFPASTESKIYQEMLDDEIAKKLSGKNNLGIAKAVIKAYEKNLVNDDKGKALNSLIKEI